MGSKGRRRKSRRAGWLIGLASIALAATGASAGAIVLRGGDLIIHAQGGISPTVLPKHRNAPISLHGGGRLSTASGQLPPVLQTITIEYDRHGAVETTGLPRCSPGKLQATDVAQARRACPGAIVGTGSGKAIVAFPEQKPFAVTSPLTLFNGPPKNGDPTVLAHAYVTVPAPTTFVVPIVIEKIDRGVFGFRTVARIPRIAGGDGIPISGHLSLGRRWTFHGKRYSYLNARCETGKLQARGEFTFDDGTSLTGTFLRTCRARP